MQGLNDYFQDTAYRLGYKPYDLLPITRQAVEEDSLAFTKGMTQKEKDYYINKKMVTLLERQNRIIGEVDKQIKRRQFTYKVEKDEKSKLHNPAIVKLISDHDRIINQNIKFLDTIHRKRQMDWRRQSATSNTSSRKDHDLICNKSSISKRSNKSAQSSQSNRSAASSKSTKEKLMMVRQREKEKERQMKELFQQRERDNSKKSLRAQEGVMRRSQRIKTRSQINKQIVEENKRDLKYLENTEIKDHFERLKFKLQKTEQIRAKNAERHLQRFQKSQNESVRKELQEESRKMLAYRYNDKLKSASIRIEHQQIIRNEARNYNKLTSALKSTHAKQSRDLMAKEQQQFLEALRKNEEVRLRTAEINRYSFQDQYKIKKIGDDVRYEIARKNADLMKNKREIESESIQRKLKHKMEEMNQVQALKKKLDKQRNKIIRDLSLQRRTLDARNNGGKFNSFFDL